MAFYRLRRALKAIGITAAITPKMPMSALSEIPPSTLNRRLKLETPLKASFVAYTRWGNFGVGSMFFAIITLCVWLFGGIGTFWISIGFLLIGSLLCFFDQGKYFYATVGDCTKLLAYSNLSALIKEGAGMRDATLWEALCWISAEYSSSSVDPNKIKLETEFY